MFKSTIANEIPRPRHIPSYEYASQILEEKLAKKLAKVDKRYQETVKGMLPHEHAQPWNSKKEHLLNLESLAKSYQDPNFHRRRSLHYAYHRDENPKKIFHDSLKKLEKYQNFAKSFHLHYKQALNLPGGNPNDAPYYLKLYEDNLRKYDQKKADLYKLYNVPLPKELEKFQAPAIPAETNAPEAIPISPQAEEISQVPINSFSQGYQQARPVLMPFPMMMSSEAQGINPAIMAQMARELLENEGSRHHQHHHPRGGRRKTAYETILRHFNPEMYNPEEYPGE